MHLLGLLSLFISQLVSEGDALRTKREVILKRTSVNIERNAEELAPIMIELSNWSEIEEENHQTQMDFLTSIDTAGIQYLQRARFSSFFNALSIQVPLKHLDYLYGLPQVKAIWPVVMHQQHAPIPAQPSGNLPSSLITNSFISTSVDRVHSQLNNTGAGVRVGIIDTGVDYKHPALGGCFGPGCRVRYGWDFIGDNFSKQVDKLVPDPDPMDCNGHGTHVAGIVGANGVGFTGVAPDAILGAYRVLDCNGNGPTDAIIQAVEMAIRDKMDIINLSLGSNSPFPSTLEARMIDYAADRGILIIAAAGNEGANGQWTIGEPSTASRAISVASFESPSFLGQKVVFGPFPEREMFVGYSKQPTFSFEKTHVMAIEYDGCEPIPLRLDRAIVLLNSKKNKVKCSPSTQHLNAERAGAVGVIMNSLFVEPNVPFISPSIGIPIMGVNGKEFDFLLVRLQGNTSVTMSTVGNLQLYPSPYADQPSSFSSWGPDFELNLKPDIGAPGGTIYSTYPLALGGYAYLKGTSMASPYLAGSSALILKARREAGIRTDIDTLRGVLLSSGIPASDKAQASLYIPVGKQGAGLIDVWNAIHTTTLVSPQKISLNDTTRANLSRIITITNTNTKAITYSVTHRPAMSVNGYSEEGLLLGSSDFLYSKESAKVSFDVSEVTVKAGQSAQVTLEMVAPTFNSRFPWVYSGYIFISGSDGIPPAIVPYVGVVGDFSKLSAIRTTGLYTPSLIQSSSPMATTTYDFRNKEAVLLTIPLIHPTKKLAVYVINEQKKHVGWLALNFDVGRSLSTPLQLDFTGTVVFDVDGSEELLTLANGRYHVVVETLKPFTKYESDRWVSPLIEIINF